MSCKKSVYSKKLLSRNPCPQTPVSPQTQSLCPPGWRGWEQGGDHTTLLTKPETPAVCGKAVSPNPFPSPPVLRVWLLPNGHNSRLEEEAVRDDLSMSQLQGNLLVSSATLQSVRFALTVHGGRISGGRSCLATGRVLVRSPGS